MKLSHPKQKEIAYYLEHYGWQLVKELKCKGQRVRMGTRVTCNGEGSKVFTVLRLRQGQSVRVVANGKEFPVKNTGSVYLLNRGMGHGWENINKCQVYEDHEIPLL